MAFTKLNGKGGGSLVHTFRKRTPKYRRVETRLVLKFLPEVNFTK